MSTVKSKNVQVGTDSTPSNNFTWYQPVTPDGTVRLGRGDSGSVTDVVTVNGSGNVGIGTNNPQDTLDITRQAGTAAIRLASQGSGSLTWRIASQITGVSNTGFAIRDETNSANRLTIDGSGNLGFNSGYGSVATAYGCRAWVNFNGTGTVAIRASGNVSSITDNGAGAYTVNFATAMPAANYAAVYSCSSNEDTNFSGGGSRQFAMVRLVQTTSVGVQCIDDGGGLSDSNTNHVAVFR